MNFTVTKNIYHFIFCFKELFAIYKLLWFLVVSQVFHIFLGRNGFLSPTYIWRGASPFKLDSSLFASQRTIWSQEAEPVWGDVPKPVFVPTVLESSSAARPSETSLFSGVSQPDNSLGTRIGPGPSLGNYDFGFSLFIDRVCYFISI